MEQEKTFEKVMICGVQTNQLDEVFNESMWELRNLVNTAHGNVIAEMVQHRHQVDQRTIIGSGKLREMKAIIDEEEIETVIFNQPLTPRQSQHLEEALQVKIIDRVQLILDIFAMRAQSKTGQLQVELAQINYLLPRLAGEGSHLSRLGGGIGTRGPGETKLETDRRHLRRKMSQIKSELKEVAQHRERNRRRRSESDIVQIGLVGYTNAGKSTLLSQLTQAETYIQDELFATLDPLTKRWTLPNGLQTTVTDTVGFIQDLPTELVEAFQSTLEESRNMDILFHVVDAASPTRDIQEKTVLKLIDDLGMNHIPILTIYNKADLVDDQFTPTLYPSVLISAKNSSAASEIIPALEGLLKQKWQSFEFHILPQEAYRIAKIAQTALIERQEFNELTQQYEIEGFLSPKSHWFREFENLKEKTVE